MHWLRRRYVLGFLALLLALPLAALIFSAPLLNDFIRPRLVSLAAERLAAEVTVGSLSWRQGALQIDDLLLQRPAQYRLEIPRLRLELNLGDLLQRRLTALTIESPFLQWQQGESSAAPSGGFPAEPPLNLRRLTLRQGRISYRQADTELNFRGIDVELRTEDRIRFQLQAVLAADKDIPLQMAGEADWREGLQLTLLRLNWADRSLLAEPLSLSIPQGAASAGSGRMRLARFDRSALEQLWSGLQQPTFWPEDWDFSLQDLELAFQWTEQQGPQLQLQIAALQLQKEGLNLPITGLEMTLRAEEQGWRGQGSVRLAEQNPAEFSGYWAAGRLQGRLSLESEQPARLITRLVGGTAPALAGGLALTAEFNGDRQGLGVQVEILGRAGYPDGREVLLDLSSVRLQADLQTSAEGVVGQAQLQIEDRSLLSASGNLERVQLQLATSDGAHWRSFIGPALRPPGLRVLNGFGGSALLERQSSGSWAVSGRFAGDRVVLDALQMQSLSGKFSLGQGAQGLWNGQVSGAARQLSHDTLVLADLTASTRLRYENGRVTFNALQGAGQLAGPGQTSGRMNLAGSGFWKKEDWQLRLAELKLEHLEWISADGLAGLSGGRAVLKGQVDSAAGQPLRLKLGADLAAAEGLWGAYYGDLSPLPIQLEAELLWNPISERVQLEALDLRLEPIARLQGKGQFGAAGNQFAGILDLPQLEGPASEQLVRLLADNRPELAETAIGGGLGIDFNLQQGSFWRLQGMLRPRQLSLALPAARLSVKGLNGYVPLDLLFSEDPSVDGAAAARAGRLQFDEGQLGPVRLATTPLNISVTPNRLALQNPLVLEVAGGCLSLDDLLLGSVAEGLLLTGQVRIAGVDLELLTAQLELAPMKGGLDADLGRIHYRGGLLRSEGAALIEAFGGRIRIDRIGLDISNLSYPQFTADIDFQAIDLYQLTQTFAFGAMNGIVDGHIHNLRLLGTTPSQFSALVETRLEGQRNISVRALNNLTILSQGGLSAALSRGIYQFIDFYRYRRIGIACKLERDLFQLRGIARSDTDRYLVDGGLLPPKIDIIAPPSAIAFSEMLKRLQRIERAD